MSFFFLFDSVKLLCWNEDEPHEKELGHVTIQLFESDVKRKKKLAFPRLEKARSSFSGITKITAENPHTFQEKLL